MAKKKGFKIKEEFDLSDFWETKGTWVIDHAFLDTLPIKRIEKSFKVKNYSEEVNNDIIKNMIIEIEWIELDDDKYFVKELRKNLSRATEK